MGIQPPKDYDDWDRLWQFPFICTVILGPLIVIGVFLWGLGGGGVNGLLLIVAILGEIFNCKWANPD